MYMYTTNFARVHTHTHTQEFTNPGRQLARATKFFTVAPNMYYYCCYYYYYHHHHYHHHHLLQLSFHSLAIVLTLVPN